MILYHEALEILKLQARRWKQERSAEAESIQLEQALGRTLCEDIYATEDMPSFDNSAMDGFCVNSLAINDAVVQTPTQTPTPTQIQATPFPVLDVLAAGDSLEKLDPFNLSKNTCVQIMTGAQFPSKITTSSYDAVIKIEDVEVFRDQSQKIVAIKPLKAVQPGQNIRRQAEDIKIGQLILKKDQILRAQHLLVLASLGVSRVQVYKKIKIGILATGEELVHYSEKKMKLGQIRNSTNVFLHSFFLQQLAVVENYGLIQDQKVSYIEKMKKAFSEGCDLFISTGAVSQGIFDFVKEALKDEKAEIHFHKCAIRPGKPILFASVFSHGRQRFVFGLPGNAVATVVGAEFFVRPFLNFIFENQSSSDQHKYFKAELVEDIKKTEGQRCFFQGQLLTDEAILKVRLLPGQSSSAVHTLTQNNCWIVLPEQGQILRRGTVVDVEVL